MSQCLGESFTSTRKGNTKRPRRKCQVPNGLSGVTWRYKKVSAPCITEDMLRYRYSEENCVGRTSVRRSVYSTSSHQIIIIHHHKSNTVKSVQPYHEIRVIQAHMRRSVPSKGKEHTHLGGSFSQCCWLVGRTPSVNTGQTGVSSPP